MLCLNKLSEEFDCAVACSILDIEVDIFKVDGIVGLGVNGLGKGTWWEACAVSFYPSRIARARWLVYGRRFGG